MKFVCTLIVGITLYSTLNAQNYLNHSCVWKERHEYCGPGVCSVHDITTRIDGDTLINGFSYYVTIESARHQTWDLDLLNVLNTEFTTSRGGLLREANGNFYTYVAGRDTILHNFNLNVGDIVVQSINCDQYQPVISIDSVEIFGDYRNIYKLHTYVETTLIEGVGSSKGLFDRPCIEEDWQYRLKLQCFGKDGLYHSFENFDCETILPTQITENSNLELVAYPNPMRNLLNLEFQDAEHKESNISIYDMNQRLIFSTNMRGSEQVKQIDVSNYPRGVYIVKFKSKEYLQCLNLIKIE